MFKCDFPDCEREFNSKRALSMHRRFHDPGFMERKRAWGKTLGSRQKKYLDKTYHRFMLESSVKKKAKEMAKASGKTIAECIFELLYRGDTRDDSNVTIIKRGDYKGLCTFLEDQKTDGGYCPAQLIGYPASGKTTLTKELIQKTNGIDGGKGKFKFIVIDPHEEYKFLPICGIPEPSDVSESMRFIPNSEMVARGVVFDSSVSDKMLKKKWPDDVIIVIDEAFRFKENVEVLLQEMRKWGRLLVISPTAIIDEFPVARVVRE